MLLSASEPLAGLFIVTGVLRVAIGFGFAYPFLLQSFPARLRFPDRHAILNGYGRPPYAV